MRRWVFFALAAVVLLADQLSKAWAVRHLLVDLSRSVVPGFVYLTRTTNTGGAFGLFPSATSLLALMAVIAAAGILFYTLRASWPLPWLTGCALALPLGGAAGNFLDRVRLGHVIDFVDVRLGSYNWPVFNIADSAICIGVLLLAFCLLRPAPARTTRQEPSATTTE